MGARFCPNCGHAIGFGSPEERRVVTVLFADLVGFTTFAEHRDPEQVKRLVDGAFEQLVADVERFGGRVDKVLGDAIIALFGAPTAHEDDAERAVRAGLRMHQTLAEYVEGREGVGGARLRVGINTGEVLVGTLAGTDYTAMGDVVNTASRLQELAPPGGVLVGHVTRELVSDAVTFELAEEAVIRGREQREEVWLASGVAHDYIHRLSRCSPVPFVGRQVELMVMRSVIDLVNGGRSAIVSVVGEAGVGKTRLVDQIVTEFDASVEASVIVEGRCAPYGEFNIWWPITGGVLAQHGLTRDMDSAEVRQRARTQFDELTGSAASAPKAERFVEVIAHLLGHPSEIDQFEPAAAREAAFTAIIAILRWGASRRPVVLWIDDLQWAAPLLRDLLEVIARSLADLPLLIVTTYRPGDDEEWPPPIERAITMKLPLGPLDEIDSTALIDAVVGRPVSNEMIRRLFERSGGNPLFLTELARLAATSGDLAEGTGLPGSVRALIAARLDQFPPGQRAIIENAAVLGQEGPVVALDEFAAAMGQVFRRDDLDALNSAGMIAIDSGWWQFRSDVVREVAYQTITKRSRALRHVGVSRWLATRQGATLNDRAHHAAAAAELLQELGPIGGVPASTRDDAVHILIEAAEAAYRVGSQKRGVELAHRALDLVDDSDADARRRLLYLYANGLVETRSSKLAWATLAELLESARAAGDRILEGEALRLTGVVDQNAGDLPDAQANLSEAVEIFRELGDERRLATALRGRGFAEVFGGSLREAECFLSDADAIYDRLGDAHGRAWTSQNLAWVWFLDGDFDRAHRGLDATIVAFEELDDHAGQNWSKGLLAYVFFHGRKLADAERLAQEVLAESRRWGDEWGVAMMLNLLAALSLWAGDFEDAVQYGERSLAGFQRITDRFGAIQALGTLTRSRIALGRFGEAQRETEELLALSGTFGELAYPGIAAAGAAMHMGHGARTAELASNAVASLGSTGANVGEGLTLMAFGQLQTGDADGALATLGDIGESDSPFVLAARATASAMIGDYRRAIADADRVAGYDGVSYFDRIVSWTAGTAAACAIGADDADERVRQMLHLEVASNDVVISAYVRAVARLLGVMPGEPDTHVQPGWAEISERLVAAN